MCCSTCFGRLPVHHQAHTTALGASGFTIGERRLERCCRGLADHEQKRSNRLSQTVKPEAPSAVVCS